MTNTGTVGHASDATAFEAFAEAREMAGLLVGRLADQELVAEAVAASQERARYPFGFGGASLMAGDAGTALVFQYAARETPPDARHWRELSHQRLLDAVGSTHEVPLTDPGLATGTAGLALAVADLAEDEPRYASALRGLDADLATQVVNAPSWRAETGVRDNFYDVVLGSAGTLAYLASVPRPHENPMVAEAVRRLVDDLVWMCGPVPDGERPRWVIPPELYPNQEYLEEFPHGYVNLGLAHGLPGVLAALAVTWSAGYRHDGLLDTVRHVADYLVGTSVDDEWGRNWPRGVPLDESGDEDRRHLHPARTAWCYGAPGVVSALLTASSALADDGLRAVAVDGFEAVLRRVDAHGGRLASATLCHGTAGVLALCARFARETGSVPARASLAPLTRHLLDQCDPGLPLGVQDLEQPGVSLDSPALLTGSAGVALALWSATSSTRPPWERALLIS